MVPPSVQINRLNVYPHSYKVTNDRWRNNRPVIIYSTVVNDVPVYSDMANWFVGKVRAVRNVR